MKKGLLFIVLIIGSCVMYAQDFIHATYLVGSSLKDLEKVKQIDYSKIQYIYLMAAPNWNQMDFTCSQEDIIQELVTDYQYAKDGDIEIIPLLIEQAHKCGTKVLLSFAGKEEFKEKVSSIGQQKKFINVMMRFIDKYHYDGIEIDWEKELSLPLHVDFLTNIRLGLDSLGRERNNKHFYLTTALHSWQVYSEELANKLSACVDWINIMTYDMGGGVWGNVPTHNTPLNKMEKNLKNWNLFERNKLCIGLANYGFIYKNLMPEEKIEGKLKEYGAYISYNDLLPLLRKGWVEEYDRDAKVSYYYSPDKSEFVTIENPKTILDKIKWVTKEQYRGAFWWEFNYDAIYPATKTGKIRHHLIDVVCEYLNVRTGL
ncbi:glycoside hydrolase family 18 protein [Bacteroides fragilis]|uniref:glycoside hydrolase family 18 protein n=1 Tax=Bacteroides fragilis TaxID=817 RepID=UPI00202EAAD0|nr:glycoside hydrolase family 18 protein [Bacteroides fragilis]MCM0340486.1 glycoside hydrolase family 18 protein [Bacteroides fragilis]